MLKNTSNLKNGCTHFMRDTWNEGVMQLSFFWYPLIVLLEYIKLQVTR